MGRIRSIKPEFFRSRSLAKCEPAARLTFAGLWTEADDHGHGVADPRILKGALWALDDDVTHVHVSAHLGMLVATGHIRLYEADGDTYFEVVGWVEHQSASFRRGEPKYPLPDGYIEDLAHVGVQESAGRTHPSAVLDRIGRDGIGRLPSVVDVDDGAGFEVWWAEYRAVCKGRPTGAGSRQTAEKAHKKLGAKDRQKALEGVATYGRLLTAEDATRRGQAVSSQHGATWLNGRAFDDMQERLSDRTAGTQANGPGQTRTCADCGQAMNAHNETTCQMTKGTS
jgi:hypothetical protein